MKTSFYVLWLNVFLNLGLTGLSFGQKLDNAKPSFPVLVELFTSEGCSSCPSADEAMMELQSHYDMLRQPVYFLAYHVDYWNYLGWKDRFSSPTFTARQRDYGKHFGLNSIYTPQTIVNGKHELVGSKKDQIKKLIDEELASRAVGSLLVQSDFEEGKNNVKISYSTNENLDSAELHFLLVEKQASSKIKSGENAGRDLKHINIVRQWQQIKASKKGIYNFKLESEIDKTKYKLVSFIQSNTNKNLIYIVENNLD